MADLIQPVFGFAQVDLGVLDLLVLFLRGSPGLLRVSDRVLHGHLGFFSLSGIVLRMRELDEVTRDLRINARAVFLLHLLRLGLHLVKAWALRNGRGAENCGDECEGEMCLSHFFFPSIAMRRCRACHSWSGYFPAAASRKW